MIGVGVAYIVALLHSVSSPMCLNDTWSVVDIRSYWVPSFCANGLWMGIMG